MFAIDSIFFGLIATLIGFKVTLLAAATLLLLHALTKHARQRELGPAPASVRNAKLDAPV